tara:strand:- start:2706 stop:3353 length:648 start_codon:yes stop_codon:yes gene_type:complete
MDWVIRGLQHRSLGEVLRNDYMATWNDLYNSLKSQKKALEKEIAHHPGNVQELNDHLNDIKSQLTKDKNTFLRRKKINLFHSEGTATRNIKSWSDLAKKRSEERARQAAEDAAMAARLDDDHDDEMADPFDHAVTVALQEATRRRLADEEAERLNQLARAAAEADLLAQQAARDLDEAYGRGKRKMQRRSRRRNMRKHSTTRKKKKKRKSKKYKN